MKRFFSLFLLLFLSTNYLFPQDNDIDNENYTVIEGKYTGKNLVVLNPSIDDGFCVKKLLVNGREVDFAHNSNSFEIPLKGYVNQQLITIQMQHSEECSPIIVNSSDLIVEREFALPSFNFVKKTRLITWDIKELDSLKYYTIEQFVYGRWIVVKELGTPANMAFNTFPPVVNSGINFFRMKEKGKDGKILISPIIKAKIPNRYVEIKNRKMRVTSELEFSDVVHYEIITENGFFVKSGTAKTVDVSDLTKGNYFVNYDGKQAIFVKK
ncbi:MAG TPA: hypothetical protein PK548_05080 [Bacteroidales bacterium]|jgi:hypothetical protein|nr:hypothetical protein [Bacteroidales bacterium]HQA86911.1 hypothetical protein [Bacteroidales bacterium]